MSYTEKGDRVLLDIDVDLFEALLLVIGLAAADAKRSGDYSRYWRIMQIANQLNEGNPRFTHYEIPEEFQNAGLFG